MSNNQTPHFTIVIFGASGDLTQRKLAPALFHLHAIGALPERCRFVAFARSELNDESYRRLLFDVSTDDFASDMQSWLDFANQVRYFQGSSNDVASLKRLDDFIRADTHGDAKEDRLYYLALSPTLYESTVHALGDADMLDETNGVRRLVVEKPFGTDLESARLLNEAIHTRANEHQLFRIDHYLGKDTVQNLIVFRFGNTIFEPLWNRNYIDHVQISVLEDLDVGDRAAYYEHSGVLRDMFQSHLLQLLALAAMEPPAPTTPTPYATKKPKSSAPSADPHPSKPPKTPSADSTAATDSWTAYPKHHPPPLTPPSDSSSTTGAGKAYPSTSAPAKHSDKNTPKSPSSSANHPTASSTTKTPPV